MSYPHNSANVVHDQRSPPPPPNSQPPPPFMQSHQQPQAFPPVSQIHGQQPSIYGQPPPPFMQGHQQPQAFPPVSQIHGQQPSIYGQPQPNYSQQYPPPQPQYYYHQSQMQHAPTGIPVQLSTQPGAWSTGLCDCFTNCHNCFITHWCPCITFGKIAEIVDRGSMSCAISGALYALIQYMTGCGCIYAGYYRQKMRRQFNLPAEPCDDYILHFCCDFCALCQEYRELKHRGFDMSLGWQGNIEKNPALTIAPFIQPGMTR